MLMAEGMRVRGWPTLLAAPGRGQFLRCGRPFPLPA